MKKARVLDKKIKDVFVSFDSGAQVTLLLEQATYPCTVFGLHFEMRMRPDGYIQNSYTPVQWAIVIYGEDEASPVFSTLVDGTVNDLLSTGNNGQVVANGWLLGIYLYTAGAGDEFTMNYITDGTKIAVKTQRKMKVGDRMVLIMKCHSASGCYAYTTTTYWKKS